MSKCSRCGADLESGKSFCTFCGARVDYDEHDQKSGFSPEDIILKGTDYSRDYDPRDIVENKLRAALSYVLFLFLIPLFARKKSQFCRFHANQGMILFVLELAVDVVIGIVSLVLSLAGVGTLIVSLVLIVVIFIQIVFAVIGVMNAYNGRARELPFIGKFRILQ